MKRDYIFMSDKQAQRILDYGPSRDVDYLRDLVSDVSGDRDYAEGLQHFELVLDGRLMFQIASRRFAHMNDFNDDSTNKKNRNQLNLPFEQKKGNQLDLPF